MFPAARLGVDVEQNLAYSGNGEDLDAQEKLGWRRDTLRGKVLWLEAKLLPSDVNRSINEGVEG